MDVLAKALLKTYKKTGPKNKNPLASVGVTDTFTRADNAASLGNAETGQAWLALGGAYGISSNQAYMSTVASNKPAIVDAGVSDCTIQVTIATLTREAGIAFRAVDASNFWMFVVSSTGFTLWKVVGGSFTSVFSSGTGGSAGTILKIVLSGASITALINGTQVASVTDAALQTATKHGITSNGNPDITDRWDNFSIT